MNKGPKPKRVKIKQANRAKIGRTAKLPVGAPEERGDLVERLILRLRHDFVREHPEEGEQHAERQEDVILQRSLQFFFKHRMSF